MPKKSRPPEGNLVEVATKGGPFAGVDRRVVQRRAHKMLEQLELEGVELSIALVNDALIGELNRDYRKKKKPTDVLAFAMREGEPMAPEPGERELLGDVVISVDTARRQAKAQRRSLRDELTMLLAHGLLHLVGYDHRNDAEEGEMKARTVELEQAANRRAST